MILSPMLFILVMDILGCIVAKSRPLQHRISLYADDVVLFLQPRESEIHTMINILKLFGEASGLKTNIQKSSVYPIRCGEEELITLHGQLPCELSSFPCKYLGLPLSLKNSPEPRCNPLLTEWLINCLGGKRI